MDRAGPSSVTAWLAEIGMGQFAQTFADHGVDFELLQELSDSDLKELGILRLGDRKRIFREIRLLAVDRAESRVQRRLLSVFFCDMVDSTSRSNTVDPEQFRIEMKLYQDTVINAVNLHAGFVARLTGDGVLAYFGWPYASEDQASQAVRAAFEAMRGLQKLEADADLSVHCRVGIATGRVVVGGQQDLDSAFGRTPNLAARLQALAGVDQIVIDAATHKAIGDGFETAFLEHASLKGFDQPQAVWAVHREREYVERFQSRGGARTPFVARDKELGLLENAWACTLGGTGSVVLMRGDPGIGKSRLVNHFCQHYLAPDATILQFHCNPHHVNSAFYPVIQHLGRISGIRQGNDGDIEKLEKMKKVLHPDIVQDQRALSLICALLSIGGREDSALAALTPQARRRETIEVLIRQAQLRAGGGAVVYVVEDVHWIDPSTRELLDFIISKIGDTPLLVLVTCRRNSRLELALPAVSTVLDLDRMDDTSIARLARNLDAGGVLSANDIADIVQRVDGIPLFAEEITLAAIEQDPDTDSLGLPESLEASLAARLDNLGDAKFMIQIAAVIGREFRLSPLCALARQSEAVMLEAIAKAIGAGLLGEEQAREGRVFRFAHALIQDVAYNSLLITQRRELHSRLANTVLDDTVRHQQPELVAEHLTRAGETAVAIEYWQRAGRHAAAGSATAEAIAHFRQGLSMLPDLPRGEQRDELEFGLRVGMAMPLIVESGYTSDDLKNCINCALAVSKRISHTPGIYSLLYSKWGFQLTAGLMDESLLTAHQFAQLAEQQGDDMARYASYRMLGASHMCLGELELARDELDRLVNDYDPDRHASLAAIYGVDLRVAGRCFLGEVLCLTADIARARESVTTALAEARKLDHLQSQAISLHFCGLVSFLLRDAEGVSRFAEQMLQLAEQHAVGAWPTLARSMLAWSKLSQQMTDSGLAEFNEGVEAATGAGVSMFIPFFYCRIAEVLMSASRLQESRQYLDKARDLMNRTGETVFRGEMLQLNAQLAWRQHDLGTAEQLFQEGLAHARGQHARLVELRVATAYGRFLLPAQAAKAGRMLSAILGEFASGDACADLDEARSLLAQIQTVRERAG